MSPALYSFLGVVIGAALQYLFTRHIEDRRHIRDLRSKAYMDYLNTVAELASFRSQDGTNERVLLNARTADAKARISLYGSNKVIEAFSRWESMGPTMATREQREAFISMIQVMRKDSGSKRGTKIEHLQNLLLGVRD